MKKLFLLAFLLLTFKMVSAQWTTIDSTDVNAIWLVQPNDGWAFGKEFRHWDGASWTTALEDSAFFATACYFTHPDDGWVFGMQDSIYRYNGSVWTKEHSNMPDIIACDFLDSLHGWALSENMTYRFHNGNWTSYPVTIPVNIIGCFFTSISMVDTSTAWISGWGDDNAHTATSCLFKFSAGQWMFDTAIHEVNLRSVCITGQTQGWAGGFDDINRLSKIYRYDGSSWVQEYSAMEETGISTIYDAGNNIILSSDGCSCIKSYDGFTWAVLEPMPLMIFQFSFPDHQHGWALGLRIDHPSSTPDNKIFSISNAGLGLSESPATAPFSVDLVPNPAADLVTVNMNVPEEVTVQLFDLAGRRILEKNMNTTDHSIDLRLVPSGLYVISVSGQDGRVLQKLVKE